MLKKIQRLFSGDSQKRKIDSAKKIVAEINSLEPQFEAFSDADLCAKTDEFRQRLQKGATLDSLLPEAFATVREAGKRVLGQRHYDVQLICGINLHKGSISELRTGEGKTLSATLPLYLNALEGKGAHLVTVNDYLARRDARWMASIYHFLGMSVGVLQAANSSSGQSRAYLYDPNEGSLSEETNFLRPVERKDAYLADITYGTNSEFGFDYLRDNITMSWNERAQRGHHFAIIDEVDNILIDEARTPLIISGASHDNTGNYLRTAQVVKALNPEDYDVQEKDRSVSLTEAGIAHVEEMLGERLSNPDSPEDLTPEQAHLMGFLEQSLRARFLFHRNKDYIVEGNEVVIVDEFTGRKMPGRRWSDGLHQAVEAKEGVKVQPENMTHATITIQNYFRMYKKLAGMTGTAITEEEEFFRIYGLEVLTIPTNLEYRASRAGSGISAMESKDEEGYDYVSYYASSDPEKKPLYYQRKDYPDIIYRTVEGKLRAIVLEIVRFHVLGRPQLVGTTSVENSELLSERLVPDMLRRVLQVNLIRQAWLSSRGAKEEDFTASPELAPLNEPLDKLRMPELRRLGNKFGLGTLDPLDESNREAILKVLRLKGEDWPRLQKLLEAGLAHKVLNARQHTAESLIIASAGAFGAVTIATNMAGRGVDIKLGGELSESSLAQLNRILATNDVADPYNMTMPQRLEAVEDLHADLSEEDRQTVQVFTDYMANMALVHQLGGLHVIGTERHEARRIDNQLRGRAGRQGDPGSSRFYLSLEDDLMRMFGGQQMESLLTRFKVDENIPIEHSLISKVVEQSQTRVEGANFDSRKHTLEYDDVLNVQRNRIYAQRDLIFTKKDLHEDLHDMIEVELKGRTEALAKDKQGALKLLSYLEAVQPVIETRFGIFPSYSLKKLCEQLSSADEEEALLALLMKLARKALEAENRNELASVTELLETRRQVYKALLEEKIDVLDAYLDSFDPAESPNVQADLAQIIPGMPRLSADDQNLLLENPNRMKKPLRESLQNVLYQAFMRQLLNSLQQRFKEDWGLSLAELSAQPWEENRKVFLQKIGESQERKLARFFGENGEVQRDLEANRSLLTEALKDDEALLRLVKISTQGKAISFDPKSHRTVIISKDRLSYVYSMADELQKQAPQALMTDIMSHLQSAEAHMAKVFGQSDWEYLSARASTFADLQEETRAALQGGLGAEVYTGYEQSDLAEIPTELQAQAQQIIGEQAQNRVYRDLLLTTISSDWVNYLTKMEALRVSISMESYAQRDPLVQYKTKASEMFTALLAEIRQTAVGRMFRYRPVDPGDPQSGAEVSVESGSALAGNAPDNRSAKVGESNKKRRKRH